MKKAILLIPVFICCLVSSYSQPGQLDSSFGNNGIVTTDFGISTGAGASGRQVLTQNDGSIYLIGSDVVTRFHANGTIDSSYGYYGNSKFIPFQIAQGAFQSDGKIAVAGFIGNYRVPGAFYLARFNTDGSLDTTFSGDGMLATGFGCCGRDAASSIAIQSDGKIVVAGTNTYDFALARFNTDGTLDATFSEDGQLTTDFATGGDAASSIAIQSDGKIVVAGTSSGDFALARYNTDGSPDTTFSGDGIQTTDIQPRDNAPSMALQDDGKVVVVGNTSQSEDAERHFTLARYNTDGSLDTTFSGDGIEISDFPARYATSVAIQSDGKIVAVGTTYNDVAPALFVIARYNTDGTPDSTFSEDGRQIPDFATGNDAASSVAIQNDGKIITSGTASYNNSYFALVRYNTDGSLDNTFSEDGMLLDYVRVSNTYYASTVIQNDGKIVAAGSGIARYNTDGTLDTTFSGDGKQNTEFEISSVALQSDGKIVVIGLNQASNGSEFAVARYNTDGTLDLSFSGDGKQTTAFGYNDIAKAVAIQSDGKIVVIGNTRDPSYFALARYNADGTPDSTFSEDGKQMTDFGDYAYEEAQSVAIQPDGKIVAAGGIYNGDNYDFALARYNANGTLDKTFSGDGKQTTDFSFTDKAKAVAIQSDGKIVVVGNAGALARYNTDGSLDATFSEDGKQTSLTTSANTVAIQNDGKIVIGGSNGSFFSGLIINTGYFVVARFNTNGSLDSSFGKDGTQVTTASEGGINDIAISGNKLYAVGYYHYPGTRGPAPYYRNPVSLGGVARYLLDDQSENKPPTVSLTVPYNIVKYTAPARIKLDAAATDEDGTITKVQFFNGNTRIHTETESSYGFIWIDVPVGTYTFTAKAFDDSGNVTTSNSIEVSVVEENVPPVVSIESPVDDTTYTGPATIRLIAKAHDPNDRISKVEFFNGTTLIRTENYYPYTYWWSNVQPGTYTITAQAYDDKGLSATSASVTVTVTDASVVSRPSSANSKTDVNGALSMRLNPNPAQNTLQIYTKGLQLNRPSTISVISASGVLMKTIQLNSLNKVVQLDVSSLVRGVYTVKVMSGDKVMFKQFVKS